MKVGTFYSELVGSINGYIYLETHDGIQREGKISGFRTKLIVFNEEKVNIPIEIELNGDPTDLVPLDRIDTLEIE